MSGSEVREPVHTSAHRPGFRRGDEPVAGFSKKLNRAPAFPGVTRQKTETTIGETFPRHSAAWLIVTSLVLSACATARMYEGEARLSEKVAVIRSASRLSVLFSPNPVYVKSIDGKPVAAGVSELVVEPGEHILVARCRANLIYGSTHTVDVVAQAGATYRLESTANPTTRCSVRVIRE